MLGTIVCGVDGTRQGYEATRQGARLAEPGGGLVLVAAVDPPLAWSGTWGGRRLEESRKPMTESSLPAAMEELKDLARESLELAGEQVGGVEADSRIVDGRSFDGLRAVAAEVGADLIAVGTHSDGRLKGIVLGGTPTMLLHDAPCSVLVARQPFDPAAFPARVVIALDGSDQSLRALEIGRHIAGIRGSRELRVICGTRGKRVDGAALQRAAGDVTVEMVHARPVDALVEAGLGADLILMGSRGVHGATALGSVSERTAHRAECSVLVVR
jgi:nucleotide-binding universal stress UspA family protein